MIYSLPNNLKCHSFFCDKYRTSLLSDGISVTVLTRIDGVESNTVAKIYIVTVRQERT